MIDEKLDKIIEKTDTYKEKEIKKKTNNLLLNNNKLKSKVDNSKRKNQKIDNTKTERLQKLIEENSKKYADSLKEDPVP